MNKNFKTVKKFLFILAIGCVSLSAVANNTPGDEDANLSIAPTEQSGSVVVRAWNLSASAPATIKVINKHGRAVYKEDLASGADHLKKYNFSQMKAGRYSLVLVSQTAEVARQFVVGMNGVVREDETEKFTDFTPAITEKRDDNTVRVLFNNPAMAPLTVELLDQKGRVVFSEIAQGNQRYARLINMKELPRGAYRMKISNYDYFHLVDVGR